MAYHLLKARVSKEHYDKASGIAKEMHVINARRAGKMQGRKIDGSQRPSLYDVLLLQMTDHTKQVPLC